MSTSVIPRTAGIALLIHTVATFAAFMFSGAPGGDYDDASVVAYLSAAHAPIAFVLWYIGALGGLTLVVFGTGLRRLPGVGGPLTGLAWVGAATSVTGAWLAGGVAVGMVEGGRAVQDGVPHPVAYLFTEIGDIMAVCGPALCVGVIALVLAVRRGLPMWLRVCCGIGGLCGILAPFFLTYLVYLVFALVFGIALTLGLRTREPGVADAAVLEESGL